MQANYRQQCPKCGTWIDVGAEIKPHFKPAGVVDGRMTFTRGQGYVHKACPKVPKGQRRVDPKTGEILD